MIKTPKSSKIRDNKTPKYKIKSLIDIDDDIDNLPIHDTNIIDNKVKSLIEPDIIIDTDDIISPIDITIKSKKLIKDDIKIEKKIKSKKIIKDDIKIEKKIKSKKLIKNDIITDDIKIEKKIKSKKIITDNIIIEKKIIRTVPIEDIYKTKLLIDVENMEIDNLPDGVKVATMCCSCKIGSLINLDVIEKYMHLNENDILTIKRSTDSIKTLIELKKLNKRLALKKKLKGNNFYNSITLIIRVTEGYTPNLNKEPKINIKLFKNGSIQMSGCKTVDNVNIVLNKLLYRLGQIKGKIENNQIQEITYVEEVDKIGIYHFKIDMIYCNYRICIQIDREKLYDLLKKKKVKCIYEPTIRACVIIKHTPDNNNPFNKEVSVFIFKKGNIIITGARSKNQVIETYNYINDILITHSDEISKNCDEDEELLIMSCYNDVMMEASQGLVNIN
jgi:TATA-box binding protein (TBP) (component of TFIID and TFIIIB)